MVQSTLVNRNCIRSLTQDPKWPFDKSLKMTLEQTSLVEYMLVMMTFHDFGDDDNGVERNGCDYYKI